MRNALAAGAMALCAMTAGAQPKSQSQSMSFDDCIKVIQRTAQDLRTAPVNIVETTEMRMVRFPTAEGSVLVTCSRPDRKMVMTFSQK
jgi:hypothetical protein